MIRACGESRAPVVLAMPLPGERERPCEIVTPPLGADRAERLEALLAPAREFGFRLARGPLRRAQGASLRRRVGTNPACRLLGGRLVEAEPTEGMAKKLLAMAWTAPVPARVRTAWSSIAHVRPSSPPASSVLPQALLDPDDEVGQYADGENLQPLADADWRRRKQPVEQRQVGQ